MEETLVKQPEGQIAMAQPADILNVLMSKREFLLSELQKHDSEMSELQEEYAARLTTIRDKQRPLQEALQHVEALLRLEGWEGIQAEHTEGNKTSHVTELISFIDSAYQLLEETGQPMHYRAIYSKLVERGVYIPGKDAAATLLAKISRDGRFKRIRKRGTYALSFWRVPTARSRAHASRKRSK